MNHTNYNAYSPIYKSCSFEQYKMGLFADLDECLIKAFQLDITEAYMMTSSTIAQETCDAILKIDGITKECTITDATASVGGDTRIFARNFATVHSIEIDYVRFKKLRANVKLLGLNVYVYNGPYHTISSRITQDVIYFDPPWGADYKRHKKLRLQLATDRGLEPLERTVVQCRGRAALCVLKLPKNYDFDALRSAIKNIGVIVYEKKYNPPYTSIIMIIKYLPP